MATENFPPTGVTTVVGNTSAATFIPELWSDEIVASYEKNLILANLVKKLSMQGKKGDTVHIPKPTRGVAHAKAEGAAVTIQADVESEVVVLIDQHWEYSRFIEDITDVQALSSLRQFYTEDAGYALATKVDSDLWALGKELGDGTGASWVHSASYFCDASATVAGSLTAYAIDTVVPGDVFTDLGFRQLIQKMDDADVPMDQRFFAIPPALRNAIMGIDRYVSSDFVNSGKIPGGKIGELYGVDVHVSTNSPVVETAADNAVNTQDVRAALLCHRDTFVLAEQMGVRAQTQYKQEFLSNLFTSDTLYGTKDLRPDSGFVLVVNDA
jgi:N4-gp56 family major capsid protein